MNLSFKEQWKAPAAVGVLSFAAGTGLGYWLSNRRLGTVVEEIVSDVVDVKVEVVDEDNDARRAQLLADFKKAAAEQVPTVIPDGPAPRWASDTPAKHLAQQDHKESEEQENPNDNWDQENEEEDRSPDSPYTIHKDEFEANELDFRQTALEYFAADNVLCDEKRVPIYNPTNIVGKLEFGHGSGDSDLVFVRNEKLESEFEVIRDHGSYQSEVLGVEAEERADIEDLRHSQHVPKFRMD